MGMHGSSDILSMAADGKGSGIIKVFLVRCRLWRSLYIGSNLLYVHLSIPSLSDSFLE